MAGKNRSETKQTKSRRRTAEDWAPKFLQALSLHGTIRKACAVCRKNRANVYVRRDNDPEFAAGMADALENYADRLEEVADKRAKKKSDALLMFRLKALRPGRYRDSVQHEHGGTVEHVVIYVPDDTRNPPAAEAGTEPAQPC